MNDIGDSKWGKERGSKECLLMLRSRVIERERERESEREREET